MAAERETISGLLQQLKSGDIDKEELFSRLTALQSSPAQPARGKGQAKRSATQTAAAASGGAVSSPATTTSGAAATSSVGRGHSAGASSAAVSARVATLARESFADATALVSPAADGRPQPPLKPRSAQSAARAELQSRLAAARSARATKPPAARKIAATAPAAAEQQPPSMYEFLSNKKGDALPLPPPPPPAAAGSRSAQRAQQRRADIVRADRTGVSVAAAAASQPLSPDSRLLRPKHSYAIPAGERPPPLPLDAADAAASAKPLSNAGQAAQRLRTATTQSSRTTRRRKEAKEAARSREEFTFAPKVKPMPAGNVHK